MTVDYTQPQQHTPPPAAGQPAPQKSSGCLKVFLIGCGGLIFLGVAFVAALVFVVFAAIKKSAVYEQALERVRHDQRVVATLGEPIEPGFWVRGSVGSSNGKGTADFYFPVSGPKEKATVHVVATTDQGHTWDFTTLDFAPAHGPPINALTP